MNWTELVTWNAATFILQLILFGTDSQIQAKFKIDGLEYKIGPYIWTTTVTTASTSDFLTSVTFPPLSDSEFQLFPSTSRSRWLHKKGSVYIVPHRLRVKLESVFFLFFFFFFFYSIYLKYTNRITGKCSDDENAKEKLYMYVPVFELHARCVSTFFMLGLIWYLYRACERLLWTHSDPFASSLFMCMSISILYMTAAQSKFNFIRTLSWLVHQATGNPFQKFPLTCH